MDNWIEQRRAIERSRYWIGRAGRRSRWRKVPFQLLLTLLGGAMRGTPIYARGRGNALDLKRIKSLMNTPVLVDLRNVYNPNELRDAGFTYVSIGRG